MSTERHVLLIGASRGLGLALAREYLRRGSRVTATARVGRDERVRELAETAGDRLAIEHVDITREADLEALASRLAGARFDLLFVVAGVTNAEDETVANVSTAEFERLMVTNALSPMRAIERLRDLVREDGTIAVMSSGQGSVANNTRGGFEIYRASKAALNTLMRSFAARHAGDGRTLLLTAPGWVRTELGGSKAPLSIEESVPKLADVVEAQRGRGDLRYLDYLGRTVAW